MIRRRGNGSASRFVAWFAGLVGAGATLVLAAAPPARAAAAFPPSPYDIVSSRALDAPVIDAPEYCRPQGLDAAVDPVLELAAAGEWQEARDVLADWIDGLDAPGPALIALDTVIHARLRDDREHWIAAEERFRKLLSAPLFAEQRLCAGLELARILIRMGRISEAAAQLTRASRRVEVLPADSPRALRARENIAFWRAEVLYQRAKRFDAHLAYRELARAGNPRIALAARLRLTDLSFDAGKIERVSAEYEALLPRAFAFGASVEGWALRASEAALDAGQPARALRWLERFVESAPDRDARDLAEIRMADLDVAFEDPLTARKRLSTVSGRRRGDRIGAVAAIRAIDLGVAKGSPDQRVEVLLLTLREQRRGVRRYALGVLMDELAHRGDLDGALAVATRLAYEGVDPVVTPDYTELLDGLLERAIAAPASDDAGRCQRLVRALGGRYGILIERATQPIAFVEVGLCFEEMELPWLAATVYRTIARVFGTPGAQAVALPLARSSLAIGEVALARRVATAALEEPDENADSWQAIVAEADFREGRRGEAARRLREVLEAPALARDRGKLVRMLALTFAERGREALSDVDLVAERASAWLKGEASEPAARAALIEAVMLSAHAYRHADRKQAAAQLYATIDRLEEPGALRSSARFWLGVMAREQGRPGDSWGDDPDLALGSPWGRFARFERNFSPLWDSHRPRPAAPESATP